MKIKHRMICGALLLAALLAGCGTYAQPTPPPASPSVMTSQPAPGSGTAIPAPTGYPAPNSPAETPYPAPTGTP